MDYSSVSSIKPFSNSVYENIRLINKSLQHSGIFTVILYFHDPSVEEDGGQTSFVLQNLHTVVSRASSSIHFRKF